MSTTAPNPGQPWQPDPQYGQPAPQYAPPAPHYAPQGSVPPAKQSHGSVLHR